MLLIPELSLNSSIWKRFSRGIFIVFAFFFASCDAEESPSPIWTAASGASASNILGLLFRFVFCLLDVDFFGLLYSFLTSSYASPRTLPPLNPSSSLSLSLSSGSEAGSESSSSSSFPTRWKPATESSSSLSTCCWSLSSSSSSSLSMSSLRFFLLAATPLGLRSLKSSSSSSIWKSGLSNKLPKRSSDKRLLASLPLFVDSAALLWSRSASSGLTATLGLLLLSLGAIRLARLASIFSLSFFLRYSSYSKGFATALTLLYRLISIKNPCIYPRKRGVPTRSEMPNLSTSSRLTNL